MKTPHIPAALTLALLAAAACSRSAEHASLPSDTLAGKCTASGEKAWLRAWTDDLYLWYRDVAARTDLDPAGYATPQDYFEVLKTPALTPSGRPRDQFHSHMPTAEWQARAAGSSFGYGMQLVLISASPPRKAVVAYVEPGSPAAQAAIGRGAEIVEVDGAAMLDGDKDVLNAGLFPTSTAPHTLGILDLGASAARSVTMTPATVALTPVRSDVVQSPGGRKVGYVIMNDHLRAAEAGMVAAVTQLRAAGVDDLVLDLRYNGGGYLRVASQAAYMLAGPARTSGRVFERTLFNDKYPGRDPVSGGPVDEPFYPYRYFSTPQGTVLPSLALSRLFILTGAGTCSASESLMNGLAGVDLPVYQIGATTCGKPYGFYPTDNCGTTWFSIQFQGVNARGFGDYADGFVPAGAGGASFPGCAVADDFQHALGDPAEARLAAALTWADTGACPALPAAQAARAETAAARERGWILPRSPDREMRLPLGR